MAEHETKEGPRLAGSIEEAHALHHLATADPEPERGDGTLTGPAHEAKYGLERAEQSAEFWRSVGVHPIENRALRPGDEGYDDGQIETAEAPAASENADAPRASDQ
jgi:hypothetical protein